MRWNASRSFPGWHSNKIFSSLDPRPLDVIIQELNFEELMDTASDPTRDLNLLERIEHDPDVTQASLAHHLGIAVGTVNWHLKRLIAKGYVKVKRAERRKLRYIITPEGIALRARLTVDYIEQSMLLYRSIRERVCGLLAELKKMGASSVRIDGEGDIADICRLTCIEQGVAVSEREDVPVLQVRGFHVHLQDAGWKSEH
jgi:DNA-binding MarR family transcriptional regulator